MEGVRDLTTPTGRAKTAAIGCYVPVICIHFEIKSYGLHRYRTTL